MTYVRDVAFETWSGRPRPRVVFIDAARGIAMGLVLLSHFNTVYFHEVRHTALPESLDRLCMIASPTFMIISGALLGFLSKTQRAGMAQLKTKLRDRGWLLLTFGHALILGAHLLYSGTVRWIFITDALGVSLIVGAFLIDRLTPAQRLGLSLLAYGVSWIVMECSVPQRLPVRFIQEALVGPKDMAVYEYCFPFVPWCALFLASTVLGERLGRLHLRGDGAGMSGLMGRLGLVAVAAAGATRLFFEIVHRTIGFGRAAGFSEMVIDAQQKVPPGPVYLLFYGGTGLLILSATCLLEHRRKATRTLGVIGRVGQRSLCVFIVQYYVYYGLLPRLDLARSPLWPLYFALSVGLIALVTFINQQAGFTALLMNRVASHARVGPAPHPETTWN